MEDKLVSLETAKLAKKKEFNEICQYYYEILDKPITLQKMSCSNAEGYKQPTAPTQSLLQKWLREKHNIHLIAYKNINIDGYDWCYITTDGITNINSYKTYEETLEVALQEALKLIK